MAQSFFSPPSPADMRAIRRFTPPNFAPLEPEEVLTVDVIAADNLVNRSLGRWPAAAMEVLAELIPGLPCTTDHEWEADRAVGRIISASSRSEPPESPLSQKALSRHPGNRALNEAILDREGYCTVLARIFVRAGSRSAEALRFGLLSSVSLGGFVFDWGDVGCPLCGVPFLHPKCPHTIPVPEIEREERAFGIQTAAPYYNRPTEIRDIAEISFVLVPRLPAAGVITDMSLSQIPSL